MLLYLINEELVKYLPGNDLLPAILQLSKSTIYISCLSLSTRKLSSWISPR